MSAQKEQKKIQQTVNKTTTATHHVECVMMRVTFYHWSNIIARSMSTSQITNKANNITVRSLHKQDGVNGFFAVLRQLTDAPDLDQDTFQQILQSEQQNGMRETVVAVLDEGKVVGTGAVMFQRKFIRGGSMCATIEDVAVDEQMRGKDIGKRLIQELVERSRKRKCYKVTLDCSSWNIQFYEKCGMRKMGQQMGMYFNYNHE